MIDETGLTQYWRRTQFAMALKRSIGEMKQSLDSDAVVGLVEQILNFEVNELANPHDREVITRHLGAK